MSVIDIIRHPLRFLRGGVLACTGRGGGNGRHDPSRGRGTPPRRRKKLLDIGVSLLMLGVIAFSVYQVARHMTVGLSTLRTQEILDRSFVRLELYTFRNEILLTAPGATVCCYDVTDGEKVGVGRTLGTAYEAPADKAPAIQAALHVYADRLALLSRIDGTGTPAEVREAAEAADRHYLALLTAAERGNMAAALDYADLMLDDLGRYDILTGAANGDTAAAIRAARDALLAEFSPVAELTADTSGHFYYQTDGYESVFPYGEAMTMTAVRFRAMIEADPVALPEGTVGKLVLEPTWYAAAYLPLSDPAIEVFQQGMAYGATYRMALPGTEVAFSMTIERLVPDADGALVVFSSQDMPAGFEFPRSFRVETLALEVSGYRIPAEALVTLPAKGTGKSTTGVYILDGNVVEFRKVRIRVRRDGYIIAETYEDVEAMLEAAEEADREALTADGWAYLRLNDNIITNGNELYEGKVIG